MVYGNMDALEGTHETAKTAEVVRAIKLLSCMKSMFVQQSSLPERPWAWNCLEDALSVRILKEFQY